MQHFIKRTLVFIGIVLLLVILTVVASGIVYRNASNSVPAQYHTLILGNSHAECAYNDSMLPGFKNLAQSAEAYFYTYTKTRELLKHSPNIKTVWIEYSNNQLEPGIEKWIWGDEYMDDRYKKYAAFLSNDEVWLLATKNNAAWLNALSVNVKKAAGLFIRQRAEPLYERHGWGGFQWLERQKTDSLVAVILKEKKSTEPSKDEHASNANNKYSTINIGYLKRTIELCHANGVKVILMRSPVHPLYDGLGNEEIYQEILGTLGADAFYDFKSFSVPNSHWADLEHLNHFGADTFTRYIRSNYLPARNIPN